MATPLCSRHRFDSDFLNSFVVEEHNIENSKDTNLSDLPGRHETELICQNFVEIENWLTLQEIGQPLVWNVPRVKNDCVWSENRQFIGINYATILKGHNFVFEMITLSAGKIILIISNLQQLKIHQGCWHSE